MSQLSVQRFAQIMFEEDKREDRLWSINELAEYTGFDDLPLIDKKAYLKEASFYMNGNCKEGIPKCVLKRLTREEIEDLHQRDLI